MYIHLYIFRIKYTYQEPVNVILISVIIYVHIPGNCEFLFSIFCLFTDTWQSPGCGTSFFHSICLNFCHHKKITLQLTANKRIHPRWFEQGMAVYHQLLPQIKSPHPTTSAFTPSPPPSKLLAKVAILNLDLIRAPNAETHTCSSSKPKQLSKNPLIKKKEGITFDHANHF